MDCVMNSGMFLRSNGDLVCWDDAGCKEVLQSFDHNVDYGEVYLGSVYNSLRDKLRKGEMPHPDLCSSCLMMNTAQEFDEGIVGKRYLSYLQVETSFACQLACPNCLPGVVRSRYLPKTEGGHLLLKMTAFKKILSDLKAGQITIGTIEFQGHGEPLLHPGIVDFVTFARQTFPDCHIRIVTNANFEFKKELASCGISEMVFSVDGVSDEHYGIYRINGSFIKSHKFMDAFCKSAADQEVSIKTVWKYILFDHNDDVEHLDALAEMAVQSGISEVLLIITKMGPVSRRFFGALCLLWEVRENSEAARSALHDLHHIADVATLSTKFKSAIGWSPFPERMEHAEGTNFKVQCFLPLDNTLDVSLEVANNAFMRCEYSTSQLMMSAVVRRAEALWLYCSTIATLFVDRLSQARAYVRSVHGRVLDRARSFAPYYGVSVGLPFLIDQNEGTDALLSFARKLARLYESRTDMMIPSHRTMACRALRLIPSCDPGARIQIASLLLVFQRASARKSTVTTFLMLPINQCRIRGRDVFLSEGDDPNLLLIPWDLDLPSGMVLITFRLATGSTGSGSPILFVDTGGGFCEKEQVRFERTGADFYSAKVVIPRETKRLRFDPCTTAGLFVLRDFAMTALAAEESHEGTASRDGGPEQFIGEQTCSGSYPPPTSRATTFAV